MILGIDEVGRGPWSGPLVIGAVILKDATEPWCDALTDSKKLTAKKREQFATEIYEKAAATALGWVSSSELDLRGLGPSLKLATRRAVNQILATKTPFSEIIIDGTINFLDDTPLKDRVTMLKKADLLIKEVSAASIIAKVARDQYMTDLAEIYPGYGFEKHVGYGTAAHKQALEQLGPCPEHRYSFKPIAGFLKESNGAASQLFSEEYKRSATRENTAQAVFSRRVTLEEKNCDAAPPFFTMPKEKVFSTEKGKKAESIVAEYLAKNGHQIIARNHKTKFYEIDIISKKDNSIYFTEVKYRKNPSQINPLENITKKKQQQMAYAAEAFLKYRRDLKNLDPKLAAAAVSGQDYRLDSWFPLNA